MLVFLLRKLDFHKLLVDTGASDKFLNNAEILGVDLQEADTLIHQQIQQIVPGDDVEKSLFLLPVGKIEGDDLLVCGIFRKVGGQTQDAVVDLPADDGPEAAVLIRKIVVKRLPGDAQLVAQVRNADRRIGPL